MVDLRSPHRSRATAWRRVEIGDGRDVRGGGGNGRGGWRWMVGGARSVPEDGQDGGGVIVCRRHREVGIDGVAS